MLAVVLNGLAGFIIGVTALSLAIWFGVRLWIRQSEQKTTAIRRHFTDGTLSPRNQHYYFAHVALRALAGEDPERLITALAAPESENFLIDLWNAVGKDVAQGGDEPQPAVIPAGLEAVPARVAGRSAALVVLPPPRAATEAYFVAIVLNHELDEPAKPSPEPEFYYFTLERGIASDGSPRTIFCQWEDSVHKNFGDGPPADARAFLDYIAHHFAAAPAPKAAFYPPKHPSGPSQNS